MGTAIQTEGLGKAYQINTGGNADVSLRELLERIIHHKSFDHGMGAPETIWSLRDVNISIDHGERIGLIGPNGSGKSTLLKLLSRVIAPTKGMLRLEGRVASLLEVGTGFHPELTGRENVFLNGTMLGMSRQTVRALFDEIVAFSGVEGFLDTPVKRYSSGMYTRLAFSVAAHVQTDILLVDEVLAVGDAAFQQKCIRKMEDVAARGRTVVLVSHNMSAIESLCGRVIGMEKGQVVVDSTDVTEAVDHYLSHPGVGLRSRWEADANYPARYGIRPLSFFLADERGNDVIRSLTQADIVTVNVSIDIASNASAVEIGYTLLTADGKPVFSSFAHDADKKGAVQLSPGTNHVTATIPAGTLNPGVYRIELALRSREHGWLVQSGHDAPSLDLLVEDDMGPTVPAVRRPGVLITKFPWQSREPNL